MKKYFALLILMISTHAFAAEFKTADEILRKLATYKATDIDGDVKRLKNKEKLKIDEMFDDLEATVKFLNGKAPSEEVTYEMERVCLLTFLHDPSTFAVDLILVVYDKNQDVFIKAAKRFHPYDRDVILQVLDGKSKVFKDGQG
jgi:hypothetical protein